MELRGPRSRKHAHVDAGRLRWSFRRLLRIVAGFRWILILVLIGWGVPACVYLTGIAYRKRIGFREATHEDETLSLWWACVWSAFVLLSVAMHAVGVLWAKFRKKPDVPDHTSRDVSDNTS